MSIAILGAGAFGTALAIAFSGTETLLWARDRDHADAMRKSRRNDRRLPGVPLPDSVSIMPNRDSFSSSEIILLTCPMQSLRVTLEEMRPHFGTATLVACCKGIDLETGERPSQILARLCPGHGTAILTGPSFATDIARGLPTGLTLACADPEAGPRLQMLLSTRSLRLYLSNDPTGAELGGALKNVIAIACGAAIGAGLGDSARAALMTRGFAEMRRLARHLGAQPDTLTGLSGFGDLVLTCASDKSRNYRFGHALGAGLPFDPGTTVEGRATAEAALAQAREAGIDLPITAMVVGLVDGHLDVSDAIDRLLSRPLKRE